MAQVWLVTGSSRGLGLCIVKTALAQGHSVIATARDTRALEPLAKSGGRLLAVRQDVCEPAAARETVNAALDRFGAIDVLVNNAGYGRLQSIEESPEEDLKREIDTNLMGVIYTSKAVLPAMRRQRRGHIFQVSSVGGRMGAAGFGGYAAAKWGVAGFSEVLAQEVAPHNIKVTVLEPGGMRTGFNEAARQSAVDPASPYAASVGPIRQKLSEHFGNEPGDPTRVAELIARLALHPSAPLHLLLGSDSLSYVQPSESKRATEGARWESVTRSIDFAAANSPIVFPPEETLPA